MLKTVYEYEHGVPRKKSTYEKDMAYVELWVSGFSLAIVVLRVALAHPFVR